MDHEGGLKVRTMTAVTVRNIDDRAVMFLIFRP